MILSVLRTCTLSRPLISTRFIVSIKDALQKPYVEALYLLSFKQIAVFSSMWCTEDISRLRFKCS